MRPRSLMDCEATAGVKVNAKRRGGVAVRELWLLDSLKNGT